MHIISGQKERPCLRSETLEERGIVTGKTFQLAATPFDFDASELFIERAADAFVAFPLADRQLTLCEVDVVNAQAQVVEIGEIATEPLMRALLHNNANVRKYSAEALGCIGDPRAVDLIWLIYDRNCDVVNSAVKALRDIGADRALEPLIAYVLISVLNDERREGPVGDPKALPRLVVSTHSLTPEGKVETLKALQSVKFRRTAGIVSGCLTYSVTNLCTAKGSLRVPEPRNL